MKIFYVFLKNISIIEDPWNGVESLMEIFSVIDGLYATLWMF